LQQAENLRKAGDHLKAREVLLRALAQQPDHWMPYHLLGRTAEALGDADGELHYDEQAYRLNRNHEILAVNLSNALIKQKRALEAVELLDEFLERVPASKHAMQTKGCHLINLMRYEEAEQFLEWGEAAYSEDSNIVNRLGLVKDVLGKADEAKELFARAYSLNPSNAHAANNYAMACQKAGEVDKAIAAYPHCIAPAAFIYASAYSNLGTLYKGQG